MLKIKRNSKFILNTLLIFMIFFQIEVAIFGNNNEKILKIKSINTERTPSPVVKVVLSKKIGFFTNPKSYIKISPNIEFTVNKNENKLIISGNFDENKTYDITFLKGLKGKGGEILEKNYIKTIKFQALEAKVEFSDNGVILPSTNNKKVYFRSRNINNVNISIKKILKNNITEFLRYRNIKSATEPVEEFVKENTSEVIYTKNFKIDNIKDTWVQNEINLGAIIEENNLYIIEVSFSEKDMAYKLPKDWSSYERDRFQRKNGYIETLLLLSDLSIIVESNVDKLKVKVLDFLTNEPLKKVDVELISRNNQIIEKGVTDVNGNVSFKNNSNKFYVIVNTADRYGVLSLTQPISKEGLDVSGINPDDNGMKAFIYTERDVYRPGDDIKLSIILRNSNNEFSENHPIAYTLYTPKGEKYSIGKIETENRKGMYSHTLSILSTSLTGIWRVVYDIGNQKFYKEISIENIIPYTLRNKIEIPERVPFKQEFDIKVKSNQLIGPPANGNKFSVEAIFSEQKIEFEKFKNYSFKMKSDYYGEHEKFTKEGILDKNGEGIVTIPSEFLEKIRFKSLNQIGNIFIRVFEENGRPVMTKTYTVLEKYSNYLGIENSDSYYLKNNEPLNLKIITPNLDGTALVKNRKLIYRIYKYSSSWWWDYNSYESFIRSIKQDKKSELIIEKEFTSTETPYLIKDIIEGEGELYIEVEDIESGQIASTNMYVDELGSNQKNSELEHIEVKKDKKTYKVGEEAKITFTGIKNAKALILIEEKGKIVKEIFKQVKEGPVEEFVEITPTMIPNGYIHVLLLQEHKTKDNDRPFRVYGVTPIKVVDEASKLNIAIETPKTIMPEETFKIRVNNELKKKMNYTVAIVDMGLLDITGFKTPNPWNYFYRKLSSTVLFYDNYSEIIEKPYGKIHQVLTAGGDEALSEAANLSFKRKKLGIEDVKRFKPVVLFSGVQETDENGEGEVTFKMPKYMGGVRVMVIGSSGKAFGSSEDEIVVKAPIVTTPYLPRTLKVKDKFIIPVNIIALENDVNDVKIEVMFNEKEQTQTVNLKKGEKKTIYFKQEVPNEIGKGKISIKTIAKNYFYEDKLEIAINSDSASLLLKQENILKPGESIEILQEKNYVTGSVEASIRLTDQPILGIDNRLKYLIEYPYGCLEQTVSKIFPQLFLEKLMSTRLHDKGKVLENINAGIESLSRFQLPSGGFSYWPGENSVNKWATNYAGHLMVVAKTNGYFVSEDMYNKWLKYTKRTVSQSDNSEENLYALYLLALAGEDDSSKLNYFYSSSSNSLSNVSCMYLASAFAIIGEESIAKEIFKDVDFPLNNNNLKTHKFYGNQNLKELGLYLDTYLTIYKIPNIDIYNLIVNNLKSKNWYSTQNIGYALIPLSKIIKNDESPKQIEANLKIDGKSTDKSERGNINYTLLPTDTTIQVINKSKIPIYLSYFWDGILKNTTFESFNKNFQLKREFYNNNHDPINPKLLKSGDEFWIQFTVSGINSAQISVENVALTQILPSGWEIENTRLTKQILPKWIEEKKTILTYEDFRDDRALFFFEFDNRWDVKKEVNIFLKVRAVTKGVYSFPGTTVEAMYDNNFSAYLQGFKVEVE